jgi:hypothetical protein
MKTQTNQNDHFNTLHLSHEQLCDHLLSLPSTGNHAPAMKPEAAGLRLVSAPASEATTFLGTNAPSINAVEDHLRICDQCTAELTSLHSALSEFRIASIGFAAAELQAVSDRRTASETTQRILSLAGKSNRPVVTRPLTWAIAAMLLVGATVGSIVPLKLHHPALILAHPAAAGSQAAPTAESDEALLEEVDQTLSTDVPSAMKPLSDPLANQTSNQTTGKNIDHE